MLSRDLVRMLLFKIPLMSATWDCCPRCVVSIYQVKINNLELLW